MVPRKLATLPTKMMLPFAAANAVRNRIANAIGPVMTIAGLQIGYLFGSIIVIETLFNYTGMGWLTYQALLNRDVPLIQATVFLIAAVVMLTNLAVDLLYTLVDPRIRLG